MAELTRPLPFEGISTTAHIESMARRQTDLAAMSQATEADKTVFRQKQKVRLAILSNNFLIYLIYQITTLRDMTEKVLRKINTITTVDGDDHAYFTATTKSEVQQLIRAIAIEEKKQTSYLTVVQSDGFGVAEAVFREQASDLTPEQAKALESVRKRGLKRAFPADPYMGDPNYYHPTQPQTAPYGHNYGNQTNKPGGPNWGSSYGSNSAPPNNFLGPKMPFQRFNIDKSNSICHACQQVGHWAGDRKCPAPRTSQPPPPGT